VSSQPTFHEIDAAKTPKGGWTRETLARWGVPWPPPQNWLAELASRRPGAQHPLERSCPECKAGIDEPCIGKRARTRVTFHRARGGRRNRYHPQSTADLRTESPIEGTLAGYILGWVDHHGADAVVMTQASIGPYRADILIKCGDRHLVVECDGAEYHSSPDQVQRDKRRDRWCAARGFHVMRFSGSEINRDPRGCASEVGMWIFLR
jgi:hypothetical protein